MVNAIDEEAARFWHRRGFMPSKDDPLVPFRSIADIAASLGKREIGHKALDADNPAEGRQEQNFMMDREDNFLASEYAEYCKAFCETTAVGCTCR